MYELELLSATSPLRGGEVGAQHRVRGVLFEFHRAPSASQGSAPPPQARWRCWEKTLTPALSHGAREREEEDPLRLARLATSSAPPYRGGELGHDGLEARPTGQRRRGLEDRPPGGNRSAEVVFRW